MRQSVEKLGKVLFAAVWKNLVARGSRHGMPQINGASVCQVDGMTVENFGKST